MERPSPPFPHAPIASPMPPPMAVVVMGVSGSGKSTLGAALAQSLGCRFLEGDAFHDADAVGKMAAGHPLTDDDRWPWLDRLGTAIGAAVTADGRVVAACSALRRSYRERLSAAVAAPVRFVLLDHDRGELLHRMAHRPGHYMPASLLDSQLATLERPAADECATTLDAAETPDTLVRTVLAWIGRPIAAVDA